MNAQQTWKLEEWKSVRLSPSPQIDKLGANLYRLYPQQIHVTFPSPRTDGAWEFTPQGWVGILPLEGGQLLSISPKAPISNIFRMWCHIHHLKSVIFLEGLVPTGSDEELTEPLIKHFTDLVQRRLHQGLFRAYLERHQHRFHFSGRLDVPKMAVSPWRADLPCKTQEQTADLPDNQILTWTLHLLSRGRLESEALRQEVRKVYRDLIGHTSLIPFTANACRDRLYHRLNEDYEPLHALCRFFLEFMSPDHLLGNRPMLAFRVDMAKLFEKFVASWLCDHLPSHLSLEIKVGLPFGANSTEGYEADMVIFDKATKRALAVLDTKYKCVDSPASDDVHQVRSYAEALGCRDAILIYPVKPNHPMDHRSTAIRTQSAVFRLDQNLEEAGVNLLDFLIKLDPLCS